MQMTACSIFPNPPLERHSKASLFTSSISPTCTHTHTHRLTECGASGGLHALKVSTSTPRAAHGRHFQQKGHNLDLIYLLLFSWLLLLSLYLFFSPSLYLGVNKHSLLLEAFKKWVVRRPIFTLTPTKTLQVPWWMVLTSHKRGDASNVCVCVRVYLHKRPLTAAWQGHRSSLVIGWHQRRQVLSGPSVCLCLWVCSTLCNCIRKHVHMCL